MAITMDTDGIARLAAMRAAGRNRPGAGPIPSISGVIQNLPQNLPQTLPGAPTVGPPGVGAGVAPPMPPGGITSQNGQQGIMGRGGNFQALGAAAQRRLAAGGVPGQLGGRAAEPGKIDFGLSQPAGKLGFDGQPAGPRPFGIQDAGRSSVARPGARPAGPFPIAQGSGIAQTKPLALPPGLQGQGQGPLGQPGWGTSGGYPAPGAGPNFSDFVGMVGNGTLGGDAVSRLGDAGPLGLRGPVGPGDGPMVDPAQSPAAGVPGGADPNQTPGIINPTGVLPRDAQPPMIPPRGGMAGRSPFQPDARTGYANLMSRFAY